MRISDLHCIFSDLTGICTDTRRVKKGNLFFALRGESFNGNEFATEAIEKGCSYAIIDEAKYQLDSRYILVEEVLSTLQSLASYHRQKLACPVIGITGTNGKTTTKELIGAVLNTKYNTHFTLGNLNNHIGVPLTLLRTPLTAEMLVVEMGANHPQEIAFLCSIARPDYGIITNIGKAHLEGFVNYQGVIDTKKELYEYLAKNEGVVFVNDTDNLLLSLSNSQKRITYSGSQNTANPFATIEINNILIDSQLIGSYNCTNILASCCIGAHFGIEAVKLQAAIQNYTPSNNRSQITHTENENTLILDAYNANPSSMQASIHSFKQMKSPQKTVILGDMLELGKDALTEHQNIIQQLQEGEFKHVFLVGKHFKECAHSFKTFDDAQSLKNWLTKHPLSNSTILLKGSRSIQLELLTAIL